MNEKMVLVPYGDFIYGVKAIADLDSIRAMVTNGQDYCSNSIMAVLGLEVEKNAGTVGK